jgi:hypothetical protein
MHLFINEIKVIWTRKDVRRKKGTRNGVKKERKINNKERNEEIKKWIMKETEKR